MQERFTVKSSTLLYSLEKGMRLRSLAILVLFFAAGSRRSTFAFNFRGSYGGAAESSGPCLGNGDAK